MSLKIVSFNIHGTQGDRDGHNLWQRQERIKKCIEPLNADIICLQECFENNSMFKFIQKEFNKKYILHNTYLNKYMDTMIMWDRKKFECVRTGYFWLSDTPKEYTRSWDNFRRYCDYISLKDRETGKCFTCVNVHVGITEEAQQKSAKLICDYVKEITGYPTIITGTFNARPDSVAYKTMCEHYVDINAVTANDWRVTYHKFEPHLWPEDHVDYCFISDSIKPISYAMIEYCEEQRPGKYPIKYKHRFPSDHYGLVCEMEI